MTLLNAYKRVTRRQRCPVCDRPDWCLVARESSPSKAICQRVESPHPRGEAGWLHQLHDAPSIRVDRPALEPERPSRCSAEWTSLTIRYHAAVQPGLLAELAHNLGVSIDSLKALWIGWTGKAWSFPMTDAEDNIIGIRLRGRDGSKWAEPGSRQGIFTPTGHIAAPGPTLIVEGPTETAAAIDLGFAVVGRPSCSACVSMMVFYLRLLAMRRGTPVDAVIVSNRDKPDQRGRRAGQRGAGVLFRALLSACRSVRVILPPRGIKDLRDWKRAGLTRDELTDAIEKARRHGCRRPQRMNIMDSV